MVRSSSNGFHMMRFAVAMSAMMTTSVMAQQPSPQTPPQTPIGCLTSAQQYERQQMRAARASSAPANARNIHAQALALASKCAAQFDPATINPEERPALGFLYLSIGKTPAAMELLQRVERELPANDSARATTLLRVMQAYGANPDGVAAIADCERVAARIDTIPGTHAQKLAARGALIGWANNADLDDVARRGVAAVLALVPKLTPDEQRENASIVLDAYSTRAVHYANALHADSAIAILRAAPAALPGIPDAAAKLAREITRYEMIGHPAPPIRADYWVNRQALPLKNSATILVFTANWCHSCIPSYPALTSIAKLYGANDVQLIFSIDLDGQFRGVSMTPAQEVEANRKYYTVEHGFTNAIALQRNTSGDMPPPGAKANASAYVVSYLPQVVVIDRQGIVRAFLQGWDATGNRERSLRLAVQHVLRGGSPR